MNAYGRSFAQFVSIGLVSHSAWLHFGVSA